MQQQVQRQASTLTDLFGREISALQDALHVVVGLGQLLGDAVELTEDAHLHLLGGLVGEGDSEDVTVALGILHQELDIFNGQREGLSRTRTSLIDGQSLAHSIFNV